MEIMQEITIEVSPEVAKAYQSASPQERKKIQAVVSILLQKQVDKDVAFLRELMDEISDRAKARGLTPEILESILNEP
jgi:mRNA-degrading endonuclease RelE of RelBE toxin-antitoxin system